jgi:hypothetical protein
MIRWVRLWPAWVRWIGVGGVLTTCHGSRVSGAHSVLDGGGIVFVFCFGGVGATREEPPSCLGVNLLECGRTTKESGSVVCATPSSRRGGRSSTPPLNA